jgi:hypothetical protein
MDAFGKTRAGQRCVVRGYETGKSGVPSPKVYEAEGLMVVPTDPHEPVSQPVPWTFDWGFVVTSMVEPEIVKPK